MKSMIFDRIRKKYVQLSPEEEVRQKIITFLIHQKHYPESLFRVEGKILHDKNLKNLRTDILVYDKTLTKHIILVECKAPTVKITQTIINQLFNYNSFLHAQYVVISNGKQCFCWQYQEGEYISKNIPDYEQL